MGRKKKKNKRILWILFFISFGLVIIFNFPRTTKVTKKEPAQDNKNIGLCENAQRRPVAVMLASDPVTRPLSGIAQADLVIEMPISPNGITRVMALFRCDEPEEIGSIRSARDDFIPLAASLGAIYAHWGGERDALKKLDNDILDNIDGTKGNTNAYFRKSGIRPPHNGFTTYSRLWNAVKRLGYKQKHEAEPKILAETTNKNFTKKELGEVFKVAIDYPAPYNVEWRYNITSSLYERWRDAIPETDRNTKNQVAVANLIVMKTTSQFLREQYIKVQITGRGEAEFYQYGKKIDGFWSKDSLSLYSELKFFDHNGKQLTLAPGKTWIEIVTDK